MVGQGFALLGQLVHKGGEVRFDELVEQCLLWLMALVGNGAKALPASQPAGGRVRAAGVPRAGGLPVQVAIQAAGLVFALRSVCCGLATIVARRKFLHSGASGMLTLAA